MNQQRTEKSFSERKTYRDEVRSKASTAMLTRAVAKASTCITRCAFKLGISEALMRKFRAGDAHIGLIDIIGLATEEPETFDALLEELAALRGKVVVDCTDARTTTSKIARAQRLVKESGEANNKVLEAALTTDPSVRRDAIREVRELRDEANAALLSLESEEAEHRATVAPKSARVMS